MKRPLHWPIACAQAGLLIMAMLIFLPWLDLAEAATPFVVNSPLDQADAAVGNGVCASAAGACTLRAAVQEGQATNRAVSVPAGLYELSLGHLAVTQNLTLTGAGSGKTKLDGTISSRIFDIASGGFAYIGGVTLQWGLATPGFLSHAHGGAIHNHGTLVLIDSTVRASASAPGWGGGGITNAGATATATLVDATIAGNTAATNGGGIENTGTLNAYNVTLISNSAVSGGGIFNSDTATFQNSIIANNFTGGNCNGAIGDNGHNLDSAATCGFPIASSNLNPLLGARDSTDTYAPLSGSPAIDRGSSAAPGSGGDACGANDQRGAARPQDGNSNGTATCDIGAYEVVPPDLAISFMGDSADPVQAGGSLIYTIDVVNPGPAALSNVRMIDTLPAGVTYNSYAETRGGACAVTAGHTITCNLASLDGNRVWTIYLYTTVEPATAGTIVNQASASTNGVDPAPANNAGEETTSITAAPAASFSAASLGIGESAGQATIAVNLSAAPDHSVSIDYATGGGTASAGSDYSPTSGTLSFGAGQISKSFSIPIGDDSLDEPDETIQLTLSDPSGGTLGAPASATLTIADNDGAPSPGPSLDQVSVLPLIMR
jgi:uncharacterized repeat protein (TIGR01451 family)